ncbi:MAG: family 1 glycosylhydrolase [Eubacteriales bacterium]|nr:family 1 glycosylhydrolase [Eubacteriales bacterium]
MEQQFLLGASTAAHQVEGNNVHSDFWALEQMEGSDYSEPSLDAVDQYHRYEEDIRLLAQAGLNAYRFSIEWARIEPEKGSYQEEEILHYEKVLQCCQKYGVEPVVTMHHFSSPKWLIQEGGWESEKTPEYFAAYCAHVVKRLGHYMHYVCTINEANMGLQIAAVAREMMIRMGIRPQVGVKFALPEAIQQKKAREAAVFGLPAGEPVNTFLSMRTARGDELVMEAHCAAREAMREICPELKIGATFSLYDLQPQADEASEAEAQKIWEADFAHYLPYLEQDDFIGVQNYSRKLVGPEGSLPVPEGAETTQMGYEFYPEGIGHVLRRVAVETGKPVLVTENGIGTADDTRRVEFIRRALAGVEECRREGIPVLGYLHWSLLDNFEWQEGYSKTFGLIAVDRATQTRIPKPSLAYLGGFAGEFC